MSKKTTAKGFTIVELLIVIVVMGILATIVIVTYQGVQDKANTTKNQSNAKEVLAKAEAYNSINTGYPTDIAVFSPSNAESDATVKLSDETVFDLLKDGAMSDTLTGDARKDIYYETCGEADLDPTGVRVHYWSYENKNQRVQTLTTGTGC